MKLLAACIFAFAMLFLAEFPCTAEDKWRFTGGGFLFTFSNELELHHSGSGINSGWGTGLGIEYKGFFWTNFSGWIAGWIFVPGIKMEYATFEHLFRDNFFRLRSYLHLAKYYDEKNFDFYFGVSGIAATPDFTKPVWGAAPEIGVELFILFATLKAQIRYDFYSDSKYNCLGIGIVAVFPIASIPIVLDGVVSDVRIWFYRRRGERPKP